MSTEGHARAARDETSERRERAVTVGVITHPKRLDMFADFLGHLETVVRNYDGEVELLVGNNGGPAHRGALVDAIERAPLAALLPWRVVDSPVNDIAVGRNLVIDAAATRLLAFIDDDERPVPGWLGHLVDGQRRLGADVVAGPIRSVFAPGTPHWIRTMDLHNARGRRDGDAMPFCPSGNALMDLESVGAERLDTGFGRSGGSDTEFFMRLVARGLQIRWVADAVVEEDVPRHAATVAVTLRRCMKQGANYRRILQVHDRVGSNLRFSLRAVGTAAIGAVVALPLLLVRHPRAGDWVKRAASNVGKLVQPTSPLYP